MIYATARLAAAAVLLASGIAHADGAASTGSIAPPGMTPAPAGAPADGGDATAAAPRRAVTFGPRVGLNLSNMWVTVGESRSRPGLMGGGSLIVRLSPYVALQGEAIVSQKGAEQTGYGGPDGTRLDMNLTYLEVPLLLRASTTGQLAIFGVAGVGVASLLDASAQITDGARPAQSVELMPVNDHDIALVAGAGVEWHLSQGAVLGEVRYWRGQTNVSDDAFSGDAFNRVWTVAAGYLF